MNPDAKASAPVPTQQSPAPVPAPQQQPAAGAERPTRVVGIGASAGGLEALEQFFKAMPVDSGLAFVVVQHLSPDFKSMMDELLARHTDMAIFRTEDGMPVRPNCIYLIPPRSNMIIREGKLHLESQRQHHGLNLPVDIFFESLAREESERAIGIVLSGTGSDGTRGIRQIKEAGGIVIAQDEDTAKFDGMPRSVIATGLADFVLPSDRMAAQLMKLIQHPFGQADDEARPLIRESTKLDEILRILREHHQQDFSAYKTTTVSRRIERRMGINSIDDLDEYLRRLASSTAESRALARDLLIGVTQFFRDPAVWEHLADEVLPALLKRTPADEPLRIWVPACSTGEEAYSYAIIVSEVLERLNEKRDVKIFATDIDPQAIEVASNGIYPESCAADLPPEYLKRYFERRAGSIEVSRELRQMVVFATQNTIKDPPFTKLDLVSCRNLLIYLQPPMQQRLIWLFHFALKSNGILVLSISETVGDCEGAFQPLAERLHIYRQNPDVATRRQRSFEGRELPDRLMTPLLSADRRPERASLERTPVNRAQTFLAERFGPPALLLNDQLQLMHTFGSVSRFVRLPGGAFTADVNKIVVSDLRIPLATAVQRALRNQDSAGYKDVAIQDADGNNTRVDLQVELVQDKHQDPTLVLVLFTERSETTRAVDPSAASTDDYEHDAGQQSRIADLEHELQQSKENLQATIEELETTNEELQSTNEEMLASNEELQSANEELHSVNEELYTVNAELQSKIAELTHANEDFDNLLRSTEIGVVFIDRELRIRRFTPEARKAINLVDHDIGRPISHFAHNLRDVDFIGPIRTVIDTGRSWSLEVRDSHGRWLLLRIRPFATDAGATDGAVLTFIDIEEVRQREEALRRSESRVRSLLDSTAEGIVGLDNDGICSFVNTSALKLLRLDDPTQIIGEPFHELAMNLKPDGSPRPPEECGVCRVLGQDDVHHAVKDVIRRADGTTFSAEYWAHPIKVENRIMGTVVTFLDNSERDRALDALALANVQLAQSNQELEQFASIASHDLQEPLRTIRGYLKLLADECGADLNDRGRDHIERIGNGITRLQALITDLLRYSKVSAGEISKGPVDMQNLVARVVESLSSGIMEQNAEIRFERLPTVRGNESLLMQLLQNLIGNAIKYRTAETPVVTISAHEEKSRWVFSVADNGIGIQPEHQDRIFQIFRRLHAPGEYSGTGVGLAIAKKIVARHNGRIWVKSAPAQGSTFAFSIPK